MPPWLALSASVLGGLALLAYAGERLVGLACALAERAGLAPAVIGLTIVAAGTSAPELFVSLLAAGGGSPDLAAGNIVGSNIANVTLVLGLTALVSPVPIAGNVIRLDYPFMALASWVTLLLCRDGRFDRLEGGFFLASLAAYMAYSVLEARLASKDETRSIAADLVPAAADPLSRRSPALLLAGLAAAIAGLSLGARLLIHGASGAAAALGVSERVIGLSVVAVGTSLPELVASVMAARRGHHEMALANLIGSNTFNLLGILGASAVVRPIPLEPGFVASDLWVMMAAAAALLPLVYWRRRVSGLSGAALAAAYVAYTVRLLR